MAVTLEEIAGFLTNMDLKHDYQKEKERIILAAGDADITTTHFIRAKEDGDIFEWQMQILDENRDVLSVKDHQHAGKALSHLLYLNYQTKFGTWEYDPSDGDVRLAIEIPLEDALMTQKQFKRISSLMLGNSSAHVKEILNILKTGEAPQDESKEDLMAQLEAMLAQLKGGSSSESSDDGI